MVNGPSSCSWHCKAKIWPWAVKFQSQGSVHPTHSSPGRHTLSGSALSNTVASSHMWGYLNKVKFDKIKNCISAQSPFQVFNSYKWPVATGGGRYRTLPSLKKVPPDNASQDPWIFTLTGGVSNPKLIAERCLVSQSNQCFLVLHMFVKKFTFPVHVTLYTNPGYKDVVKRWIHSVYII